MAPCIIPIRTLAAASATAPGPLGTKIVLFPLVVPISFIVSKYCV